MNYKETIEFLYSQLPAFHRIGKAAYKADLMNTYALDEYFGHPHLKFRSVHIAGTNGKGSVSHMLASVLQEAGYKTALYTSPHLRDFRERIRVNGEMIPEDEVVSFVEKNHSVLSSVKPSFFEMTVAMAFDYFARSGVELAVIEVGLGGRLDSTNIITPVLSVITNIGHDHMNLLGDSIEKVAVEKAGIIKKGVPVVVGENHYLTSGIFSDKAASTDSEIFFAEDTFTCLLDEPDDDSGFRRFSLKSGKTPEIEYGVIPLGGDYQLKNIQTVACAAEVLGKSLNISRHDFFQGIRKTVLNTGLKGRWQILGMAPLIVCDTGHNLEGLEYVVRQINNTQKDKLHVVLGFVNDKELNKVLPLFPREAKYYFTKASVQRALDEKLLQFEAALFGLVGESFENIEKAVTEARNIAGPKDMIFIGGSTFVVADALELF